MNFDVFSMFNPDWWMNENNNAPLITDSILLLFMVVSVLYLFACAFSSLDKYKNPCPATKTNHRFLAMLTVLRSGKEVVGSINHFLDIQHCPRERYNIAVAAIQPSEADLLTLLQMPVSIVIPDKDRCTKIYAIQQVTERYSPNGHDMITLFNSGNKVVPEILRLFNNAYYSGRDAMQAHRTTENLTTSIAVLNATGGETNNGIFRKGHTRMGSSFALTGSAMTFDFRMLHGMVPTLKGSDISKTMEMAPLQQNIYTEHLEEVVCYSKKEEGANGYEAQRLRQLRSQYSDALFAIKQLPLAMLRGEWDYRSKPLQRLLPSRFLLIALTPFFTTVITTMNWTPCLKWYPLLATIALAFLMALPEGKIARRFRKTIWALPILMLESIFSHALRFKKRESKQQKEARENHH